MGKYLGKTGLGRLWTKYKQRYLLKTNELGSTTYTYSESSASPIAVTVNIITTHSGSTDTLTCTLSQPVDINLLFQLSLSGSNKRFFVIFANKTSVTFTESGVTGAGSLQNVSSVSIVDELELASKYAFTINTQLLVGSSFEHVLTLENATVDWHAMKIVSGTLTRSTTASTKPKINTYISVSRYDGGEDYPLYETTSISSINASANTASISNVSISPSLSSTYYERVLPKDPTFATTASGHYIRIADRYYTSLIANIGITVNNFSQNNLQPELIWYRSSGACAYNGTLPVAIMSFTGLVAGDQITFSMHVDYDPDDPDSGSPYTIFSYTKYFSSGGSLSAVAINFNASVNSYVGIESSDYADTKRIYMDAYLTNYNQNISSQYIGSWPSSSTTGYTGVFAQVFSKPNASTRPVSTNTSLFGRVKLNGKLW